MVPVNTVPFGPLAGVTVKGFALHIVSFMSVIADTGLTVIVTVNGSPVQPFAAGVTVSIAVFGILVPLFSVPLMFRALLPAAPPERPLEGLE